MVGSMRMTVVGCRAGMPADGQASSGYLVSEGADTVLLDCGPGVALGLSGLPERPALGGVLISHLHLDHCYDLLPLGKTLLSAAMDYPAPGAPPQLSAGIEPVPLYVPAGGAAMLRQLAALFPVRTIPLLDRAFDLAFEVREYGPGDRVTIGGLVAGLLELRHSAPNCGIRVEGRTGTLAYTGDTGTAPNLVPLASGAGMLLAEATLDHTDPGPHGHLSAANAGRAAAEAGAASLVLTHFRTADRDTLEAQRDQAAAVYPGPIHLAQPGTTLDVPGRVA